MSDLARRPDDRPTRRQREQRAYRLVLVGGGAGIATIATGALWVIGAVHLLLPLITALVTAVCVMLFLRAVKR